MVADDPPMAAIEGLNRLNRDPAFRASFTMDDAEQLLEGRVLDMTDLDDRRSGALATVSRYLGDHLKVGVGYNFTDFSDDLTDLSYDHHGYFLNLTGTM